MMLVFGEWVIINFRVTGAFLEEFFEKKCGNR
jgi:hypothetical protein